MVFGSKINPYKHYSAFDTFQEAKNRQPAKKREEKRQQDVITEAPETIMQGDTLQHYEQRQYNFKPAMKELPQIMLPTDLTLKGIVSLDFQNLTDTDPFMPSKGGLTKNLPMIPEPKMLDDQNPNNNNNNETGENNQPSIKPNNNSNVATTYTPGSMVTFNTFNKGIAPVYHPPENNPSNNNNNQNQTNNNNIAVNNRAPPPPPINLTPIVNAGAPPPPMLNLSLPKSGGGPPAPPLINNLASLGIKSEDSENKPEEHKPAPVSVGEGGRCNIYYNFKKIILNFLKNMRLYNFFLF